MDLEKFEKLEQKNIDRATTLVVRLKRQLERNLELQKEKEIERDAEQARHLANMHIIRQEAEALSRSHAALTAELEETHAYLVELTKQKAK